MPVRLSAAPELAATWRWCTCSSRRRGAAAPRRIAAKLPLCCAWRTASSAELTSCSAAALAADNCTEPPPGGTAIGVGTSGAWPWLGGGAAGGWPSDGGGAAGGCPFTCPATGAGPVAVASAPGPNNSVSASLHGRAVADPVVVHHRDADQARVRRRRVARSWRGVDRLHVQQAALGHRQRQQVAPADPVLVVAADDTEILATPPCRW